ncbi:MAG TPA: 50S ribosomal protein L9 [Candidatus Thiothrix moscowensis]|uniref:50S ribosomal protein L9 n=1 Tax=unclassified Thiothrix TaxID=2636184 RepID=UPI001A2B4B53|nr:MULTISPECIES: 50S ribosomal protein L9 [unclassified Thiothrix]MBJ6609249.1 50S ribosomal protein L9 [Candidatus Thiothrix moscowensis]HRJ51646.1 50S ribosomal protein L9 [Candidatus Thiothrix moscowensis]HRJ91961.1 50S ribosomal protein L9 [Candidatus Thiothrix moscowensis]
MEVILLKKVENLGALGSVVSVRPGYARNYLIPQGKAQMATKANMEAFEARRVELEAEASAALAAAEARKAQLDGMVLTIKAKAGNEGKLFGSVSNIEITEAIVAAGVEVERREIRMPDGAIRHLGEFEVGLHLHTEVNTVVKVVVEAA